MAMPMDPQQQPPQPEGGKDQVGELVAKISQDLLALREASPEAFGQLVESLVGEAQAPAEEEQESSSGPIPQMAGSKGVPMSHGR